MPLFPEEKRELEVTLKKIESSLVMAAEKLESRIKKLEREFRPSQIIVGPQDISGLVPYIGATDDVDLGIHNLATEGKGTFGKTYYHQAILGDDENLNAGYFTDGTVEVYLVAEKEEGYFYEDINSAAGYFYDGVYRAFLADGNEAGYFTNGSGNSVHLANADYAIDAIGNSLFTGGITVTGEGTFGASATYQAIIGDDGVNSRAGYFASSLDEFYAELGVSGQAARFYDNAAMRALDFMDGSLLISDSYGYFQIDYAGSAYFYDGANEVYLTDGYYAISAYGDSYFDGDVEVTGNITGTGSANVIVIPTSDPGVANAIWVDAGVLKVSTG